MAAASKGRNDRRAVRKAEAKRKRKSKSNGAGTDSLLVKQSDLKDYAKTEDVNRAFQQLSGNQEKLGNLFNVNMREIKVSFGMTDSWHHVFRRVMNDMVKGNIVTNDEGVHWDWYFKQYGAVQAVALAVGSLKKEEPEQKEETESPPPEYNDDLVFGGDYANQNSPPG